MVYNETLAEPIRHLLTIRERYDENLEKWLMMGVAFALSLPPEY